MKRLLAIWTACLLGICPAQTFDLPSIFAENERIPLAILLEAFKRDANSEIYHCDYGDDVFDVKHQWMVTGEGELEFIDLNGQVLWAKKVNGGQTRVTVPEVASGMYLFRLTNGKETKVQ